MRIMSAVAVRSAVPAILALATAAEAGCLSICYPASAGRKRSTIAAGRASFRSYQAGIDTD
jgi:hypothetical protein